MAPIPGEFARWRTQLVSKAIHAMQISVQQQVIVQVKAGSSQHSL